MKNLIFILTAVFYFVSCTKLDDSDLSILEDKKSKSSVPVVIPEIKGTWQFVSFFDRKDKTSNYSGATISFNSNSVAILTLGGKTYTGTWKTVSDSGKSKLVVNFISSVGAVDELSDDWVIDLSTTSKLELSNVSGGDGHISSWKLKK